MEEEPRFTNPASFGSKPDGFTENRWRDILDEIRDDDRHGNPTKKSSLNSNVGEMLMLGFHGTKLPHWMRQFAKDYGLGGVILFDKYVANGRNADGSWPSNNIESPEQLKELCAQIHALPSHPLVYVDQEGGLVRRLKEEKGFAPLPSQYDLAQMLNEPGGETKIRAILGRSYGEMRELGIDVVIGPVLDTHDPENPSIGGAKRAYSADPSIIMRIAHIAADEASKAGIGLCFKHYPGIGHTKVDSHDDLLHMEIDKTQEAIFSGMAAGVKGSSMMMSHAILPDGKRDTGWKDKPMTMCAKRMGKLHEKMPGVLFITDDLQMQGMQKIGPTAQTALQCIRAGNDMVCIGNNMINQERQMTDLAKHLDNTLRKSMEKQRNHTPLNHGDIDPLQIAESIARIHLRKQMFNQRQQHVPLRVVGNEQRAF